MRQIVPVLFVSVCLAIVISLGPAQADSMKETIERVCTQCHTANRICLNLGVKSAVGWKSTVAHMIEEGADLKHEQVDGVANYLFTLDPEAEFCQ